MPGIAPDPHHLEALGLPEVDDRPRTRAQGKAAFCCAGISVELERRIVRWDELGVDDQKVVGQLRHRAHELNRSRHVVEQPQAQDHVEAANGGRIEVVDVARPELETLGVDLFHLEHKLGLLDEHPLVVDAQNEIAARLQGEQGPVPGVAAEIEHAPSRKVAAGHRSERLEHQLSPTTVPFHRSRWRGCLDTSQVERVMPARKACNTRKDLVDVQSGTGHWITVRHAGRCRPGGRCNYVTVLGVALILGCPRSGTTWTRRLLDATGLVVTSKESMLGEVVYRRIDAHPAGWLDLLDEYDERRAAGRSAGLHAWLDRSDLEALVAGATTASTGRLAARALVRGVLETASYRRSDPKAILVVEKTPIHVLYADLLLDDLPEARFVEVVRDVRDVCVSMDDRARVSGDFSSDRAEQVRLWVRAVRAGARAAASPGASGRWLRIRYEDLHRDPSSTVEELLAFVGLPHGSAIVEAVIAKAAFTRIPEDHRGPGRHFRKGMVGDWRRTLTADDLRLVEKMAAPELDLLGYDDS